MDKHANELQAQLEFMRDKLEETRNVLENLPIAYTRTSTQGEKVLKRNAAYSAYEELLAAYCKTLRTLKELGGGESEIDSNVVKFEQFAKSMRKHA